MLYPKCVCVPPLKDQGSMWKKGAKVVQITGGGSSQRKMSSRHKGLIDFHTHIHFRNYMGILQKCLQIFITKTLVSKYSQKHINKNKIEKNVSVVEYSLNGQGLSCM